MYTYHAVPWSDPYIECDRRSHHQRTKQHVQEEWTWEEILDGAGPWTQAGEYRRPKEEIEAAKAERRHYEELYQRDKHERQPPQKMFWGEHTGILAEVGVRPEPTPCAYRGERVTGQTLC